MLTTEQDRKSPMTAAPWSVDDEGVVTANKGAVQVAIVLEPCNAAVVVSAPLLFEACGLALEVLNRFQPKDHAQEALLAVTKQILCDALAFAENKPTTETKEIP